MKKLLSVLLALCLVVGCLPFPAFAETKGGSCGDNLTWTLEDGTLTISGTGAMDDYSAHSPWWKDQIKNVIIEQGVTTIGNSAFENCGYLTDITIADSVTSIGEDAFAYCSLKSISIPNSVTSIGRRTFYNCYGVKSIRIPKSVTSIGRWAFYAC